MKQERSWETTDEFWKAVEPLIPLRKGRNPGKAYRRGPGGGRRPLDSRKVLEAVFFVPRSGIQWKALPLEFGTAGAARRCFRYWCGQEFFEALRAAGLEAYDEVVGINRTWLSADGRMTRAPLAQEAVGKNPTGRGKKRRQTPYSHRRRGRASDVGGNRG